MDVDIIKNRIYSLVESSSLHMMELLKVTNIRLTDEIDSAAITCDVYPELLLNEKFIEEYCKTDEHLLMLIMHELYHIILGHTRLFKKHTEIDNIAFDAIINAMLCRMFPEDKYTSFFEGINSDESFPGCILRPVGDKTPPLFIPLLKLLYLTDTGTYYEVYEMIATQLEDMLNDGHYILIGDHSDKDLKNPSFSKAINDIIAKWPRKYTIEGRDLGGELTEKEMRFEKAEKDAYKKMKRLLKKAGVIDEYTYSKKVTYKYENMDVTTFMPNYRDRTLLGRQMLYGNPCLYTKEEKNIKMSRDSKLRTLVYLDVSGSVVGEINRFAPLLLKPYKKHECELYVFSTKVAQTTYKDFREGKYESTGGTDINCIFNHYFGLPKKKQTKKILILTDGFTGRANSEYFDLIKRNKIEIYCGLFGSYIKSDLSNIVKYFEEFN